MDELFAGRLEVLAAMKANLERQFEAEGLPWGERHRTYNSRLAQELAVWAEGQPGGVGIHDALFRAYFVDGRNLAEKDVLVAVAEGLGLDVSEARDVLTERRFSAEVDRHWQRSRELGVTAVPTFVCGGRGVVGAQPYEALERLVRSAGVAERR